MNWKIIHKPDPEFDGYPWHGPAGTEPTQYRIDLKPEQLDPNAPVWVMWPNGGVYMMWNGEPIQIGEVREMEEDPAPHSWMFVGLSDKELHHTSLLFTSYYDLIKDDLDTIITDSVHDWPQEAPEETGETCVWCEHNTAEIVDEVWNDVRMDDCDTATYQVMKCTTCGAEYQIGKKFTSFVTYTKKGKPEKSVDMGCFNCRWSKENPPLPVQGCEMCYVEPEGMVSMNMPTARNNWMPMDG